MKRDTKSQAERIGLRQKTLENWRSLGQGPPYYKLGNRVVYDDTDVDAWLANQKRTSTADPGPANQSAAQPKKPGGDRTPHRATFRFRGNQDHEQVNTKTARDASARTKITGKKAARREVLGGWWLARSLQSGKSIGG